MFDPPFSRMKRLNLNFARGLVFTPHLQTAIFSVVSLVVSFAELGVATKLS
jgi:hypothetical protein